MAVGKVVEAMFGGRFTVGLKVALVGLLQETLVLLVRKRGAPSGAGGGFALGGCLQARWGRTRAVVP